MLWWVIQTTRVKIAKYNIFCHGIVYFLDPLANKIPAYSFGIGMAVEWTYEEYFLVKSGFNTDGFKIIYVQDRSWFAIKLISNINCNATCLSCLTGEWKSAKRRSLLLTFFMQTARFQAMFLYQRARFLPQEGRVSFPTSSINLRYTETFCWGRTWISFDVSRYEKQYIERNCTDYRTFCFVSLDCYTKRCSYSVSFALFYPLVTRVDLVYWQCAKDRIWQSWQVLKDLSSIN